MASEQEIQKIFQGLDSDRDGKVSYRELYVNPVIEASISAVTKTTSAEDLLEKYDSDNDGSLTFEELKKAVQEAEAAN